MKTIKTFEEFNNSDDLELIEESLIPNKNDRIKDWFDDISSGKKSKLEKIKKRYNKFTSSMIKLNSQSKKKALELTKGLREYLKNPESQVPKDLEYQLAVMIFNLDDVSYKGDVVNKDEKSGNWVTKNVTSISHGAGNIAGGKYVG